MQIIFHQDHLYMDRYPYSIVWTPLPILSWFVPLIGHTGIANSEGVIHDFGGSYYIAVDNFTFGRPTKYLKLDPSRVRAQDWDNAIQISADKYRTKQHNLVLDNCHSHVADTLNQMEYDGRNNYTQIDVFLMMTFKSSYIGLRGFILQWGLFFVLLTGLLLLILL